MTKNVLKAERKIERAFVGICALVADSVKKIKSSDEGDVKKLKETAAVAKELFAIIKATDGMEAKDKETSLTVEFGGGGEENWAD